MMLKNTPYVRDMLNYSKHMDPTIPYPCGDQTYLIDVYHKKFKYILNLTTLNRDEFPNGKFIHKIPSNAYLIHYNYLVGNVKKEIMQKNNHWYV
jgi:hypothetical protein